MASKSRRAAGALGRAFESLLGSVTGHSRDDVADPYLLRISARAWKDLGESPPKAEPATDAADRLRIVRKFYDEFSMAERVDGGVPIGEVKDPKVFRIKAGDWRAAVRYIPDDGTPWMCRALSLAKYHEERDAYVEFGRLETQDRLLPTQKERRLARGDHFIVSSVLALQQARVNADNEPEQWWEAKARRPTGSSQRVGRIYVERELDPDEGAYVTRFVLLVTVPPDDVTLRKEWIEFVGAQIFPTDDPVIPTYELPSGTNLQADELPFAQETIELIDEKELAEEF
jgi:hypothetical protein